MRAALLEAPYKLTITEVECPALTFPTGLLIKVKVVGICASEIYAFRGTHPYRKAPVILGHEVAGQVVEVGAQVRDFAAGGRVLVDPQWGCGECYWCQSGDHNLCPSKKVLGTAVWPGPFGEYIVAPVESVYHLPEHMSYLQGCLVEPLSVAVHATSRAGVVSGESVVVLGTGPIGMMVAAVAASQGASPIIAVDIQRHCLDIVERRFGATHTLLADEGPISERIQSITQGEGVDVVFLTVGVPSLVSEALSVVRKRGRIVLVAVFDEPVTVEPFDMVKKESMVVSSLMYNAHDIRTAIGLVSSGKVQPEAMVTHVLPLEDVRRGFEIAATKADGAIKVVLVFEALEVRMV